MKVCIILFAQSAVGVPHVIDDGHADRVIDHSLNYFLDLVADEVELPLDSEFAITKVIWDWLVLCSCIRPILDFGENYVPTVIDEFCSFAIDL